MSIPVRVGVAVALSLAAVSAHAGGQGYGRCIEGFSDDTRVQTETSGEKTIGEVRLNDRVWSFNQIIGKPGWSRVERRTEGPRHYRLFVDFVDPDTDLTSKACWLIQRAG
ncbi:MAG TPA: hypothetical protein PKZ76_08790 [Xanthomonadaceae bacterium]|nr:hypothetical protein [Xanthomonadaceae bacterium]